ncbi:MAG: hypothetical protein A4S09_16405 [Proteobacteria bacterium SG_bin7]|nr:MAG: hypothetical protein A4S09_16405 [Proteobacteria bacterium SG_bin7]
MGLSWFYHGSTLLVMLVSMLDSDAQISTSACGGLVTDTSFHFYGVSFFSFYRGQPLDGPVETKQ